MKGRFEKNQVIQLFLVALNSFSCLEHPISDDLKHTEGFS